jgi:hypothetical protein
MDDPVAITLNVKFVYQYFLIASLMAVIPLPLLLQ